MTKQILHLLSIVALLTLSFSPSLTQASDGKEASKPVIIGEQISIHSKVLSEERKLLVHLPESYHNGTDSDYPVLYTLDGSTHFKHITGTVDWLSKNTGRIPEMIIVAIVNTDRGRDMTTSYNGGGGDKFLNFIKSELIPYVDNQYRTRPFRILAGHSMAGFFALDTLINTPELFNGYITMSPWFLQDGDNQQLVKQTAQKLKASKLSSRFLFASIGDEPRLKPLYDDFIKVLTQSAPKQLEWRSQVYPQDNHMTVPSNTINNALQELFADLRLSPESEIAQQGVEAIKAYFKELSEQKYGYTISPEPAINNLGYQFLGNKQVEKAIEIFQTNINEFPNSPNTYDSMADALVSKQQLKEALAMIKTAIKISEKQKVGNLQFFQRHQENIEKLIEQSKSES